MSRRIRPSVSVMATTLESPAGGGSRVGVVTALLSTGEFATVTHLSVKTLRHYHDAGLLEPDRIDPHSGYRYYSTRQVATAQIIRRFRNLDMPVRDIARLLASGDVAYLVGPRDTDDRAAWRTETGWPVFTTGPV